MSNCWFNGHLVPAEEARVSVYDHGLLYGDGVFEGIRFYRRKPFRLCAHLERLFDSARAICLNIPYTFDSLVDAVQQTIDANEEDAGYLRLVVTRGEGTLGIDPGSCARGSVFILSDRLEFAAKTVYTDGAQVIVASTRRLPADGLDTRIKSLNYLNPILARMEASRVGADEALLLNHQGFIAEGSTDNVFIVKNGRLMTPPVSDGALRGVTRGVVLELAARLSIPASESSLTPYDCYSADECFLTGTAAELVPVRDVAGRELKACPGRFFQRLNDAFRALIEAETAGFGKQRYEARA